MLVGQGMRARLEGLSRPGDPVTDVRLPHALKTDRGVRTAMFRRLSASRIFAFGDRAGVLKHAQSRSGRAFRLDVRQRVIVKALVSRHAGVGTVRAAALLAHVRYLGRAGAGMDAERPRFFDQASDNLDPAAVTAEWSGDRHHFRFIVSPEHGDRISNLPAYTREVMRRVGLDLGQPDLAWIATCHFDTDQPHAHVLVRGRRASGRDLVIPRDYIAFGFRARAQEVAHELLGDLSRTEAERRIWRETQADRFTGFDRRLLQAADEHFQVPDGVGGSDAWSALMRGRLRHLESLGLATRRGDQIQLHANLEQQLRTLQLRRDVIRTLRHRQLEVGREPLSLGETPVRGRVVKSGRTDELGGGAWVMVKDADGQEHFARLGLGQPFPRIGRAVEVLPWVGGSRLLEAGRGGERTL